MWREYTITADNCSLLLEQLSKTKKILDLFHKW